MSASHQRKIANYLLNRSYQIRHMLVMVSLCAVVLAVFCVNEWRRMRIAAAVVESRVAQVMSGPELRDLHEEIGQTHRLRLLVMGGAALLVCLLVAAFSIIHSHRVAGPVFVLMRRMRMVQRGTLPTSRGLRRGDEFQDVAASFNAMVEALRERESEELSVIGRCLAMAETLAQKDSGAETKRLSEALRQLRQSKASRLAETASGETTERAAPEAAQGPVDGA